MAMKPGAKEALRRRARVAAGFCPQGWSHGPSRRGQLCEQCAKKAVSRTQAARRSGIARADTKAFWAAMREWYASGGWRALR
jgi:hypothetical protein